MPQPNFERFLTALRCRQPDRVPLANYRAMIEAGLKYGRYPISPEV